jgi:hypothetical protein
MNRPPIRLPYLWLPVVKGRQFAYYRRGGGRLRLPDPAAPGFLAAYQSAHDAAEAAASPASPDPRAVIPGSLAALIVAYRASPEWRELAAGSQADYRPQLDRLRDRYGPLPATMPRAFVFKLRAEYASRPGKPGPDGKPGPSVPTPRRANKIVAILRLLLSWAVDHGWRRDNPALRPGQLKTGPGYAAWSEADVSAFLACPAIGEPLKRALVLGLYTGQRKGDCLALPTLGPARRRYRGCSSQDGHAAMDSRTPRADALA